MSRRRLLVTGGCGFIGSNFVRLLLAEEPEVSIVNVDALTYAGNPDNLADVAGHDRYRFVHADICDRAAIDGAIAEHAIDTVINFAAESHVDRSIQDSTPFVRTNVTGTQTLLDAAKAAGVGLFVQVSTDEVYGSLGATGLFTETTPLAPNSPYSSSKAGADLLVRAYHETFGLPTVTTRCSNNYGPYQFPEKIIPLFLSNAMEDKSLPVYGDGMNVRDWIYVDDHCRGIWAATTKGKPGGVYNFGGKSELPNLVLTKAILAALDKPESLIEFVTDRPGHDRRYAIDCAKAERELGWSPRVTFEQGLAETVAWYRSHGDWIGRIKSGAYRAEPAARAGAWS